MTQAQGPTWGIVHDQMGRVSLNPKIENPHDMGMYETADPPSLFLEVRHALRGNMCEQQLYSGSIA
jgi:hypothetical protein